MTHITIERAKARRIADAFEDLKKNLGMVYVEELVDIKQALAAPTVQEPVGTYGEIYESMQALLRSGLQRDQQIYMVMKDKPLYTPPPAAPVQELVYQMQRADGSWIDQDKQAFEYNSTHGWPVRTLYTTPPAAQRQWVELTELQLNMLVHRFGHDPMKLIIELTQELKEKNT